ncbi:MAG: hypothetical protein IJS94_02520, partial [Clostridia bacterium]|nr:hypothetical protein [Clostridia bacterium]
MNYYNYSGRKSQSRMRSNRKKVFINVLIIVLAIAFCVVFALVLGNRLKDKLEDAELSTEPIEEILPEPETEEADPAEEINLVKNMRAEGEMSAVYGYLDLAGCPDADGAGKLVGTLHENGYTGIVFCVRNANGKYAYASPAVAELTKTEPTSGTVPYDVLSRAVVAATSLGMRSTAYIDLGDHLAAAASGDVGAAIDRAVLKELSQTGFSQIIIDGVTRGHDFTIDFAKELYNLISAVRSDCPGTD